MVDKGKITGVIYIANWTPKAIKNRKSLYLVVNAEKIIPNPNDSIPIKKINTGSKSAYQLGSSAFPIIIKNIYTTKNNESWIKNRSNTLLPVPETGSVLRESEKWVGQKSLWK